MIDIKHRALLGIFCSARASYKKDLLEIYTRLMGSHGLRVLQSTAG